MVLTIGKVASQAGVNIETIRYYERRGLLAEPPRTASGYRQYAADAIGRLRFIKRAQELGFSLEEIRDLLELRLHRASEKACETVASKTQQKITLIDRKLAQLGRMRTSLERLAQACRRREPTGECPVLEALEDEVEAHV